MILDLLLWEKKEGKCPLCPPPPPGYATALSLLTAFEDNTKELLRVDVYDKASIVSATLILVCELKHLSPQIASHAQTTMKHTFLLLRKKYQQSTSCWSLAMRNAGADRVGALRDTFLF